MKRLLFIALLVVFACEDKEKDCAGVEGGTAVIDECGVCNGNGILSDCIVSTWMLDSLNIYNGSMWCSGTPTSSYTSASYMVITEDTIGNVDTDACTISTSTYNFLDNGGYGVIQTSNGINRNIQEITDTQLVFEVSTSYACYLYSYTKVTSVDGCSELTNQ